jgi:hypothetical protein
LEEDFAMKGFLKYLTMTAAGAVLIAGFTAGSARFARAGDAAPASVGTDPDTVLDLEGCWSGVFAYGYLEDDNYGEGYGWMYFGQSGKKIKASLDSEFEFVWYNGGLGQESSGTYSGTVSKTGFTATAKYKHNCTIKFKGGFGGYGIEGTYKSAGCKKPYDGFDAVGTFDLPYEPGYCYDIL